MLLAKATVSSVTFLPRVPSISSPPAPTGLAAPMRVLGAMAATLAAMVMKVPAEAAFAPLGDT